MFPASTKAGGLCQGAPDVCKVPAPPSPPVPTPFPNLAQCTQAQKVTTKVKVLNMGILTKNSQIPRSQGDEAGTAGGVVSGMNMGPVTIKTASTKLQVEGGDAFLHLKNTAHNGTNANVPMGSQVSPSQQKLFVSQ